jgi:hypothetical protein
MIFQKTNTFFIKHFDPNVDPKLFPQELQSEFWGLFSSEEITQKELFKKEVRNSVSSFFEPIGTALVILKEQQIFLKITPYTCTLNDNSIMDKLVASLNKCKATIIQKSRKDLYIINIAEHIELEEIINKEHVSLNKKEMINKAIRKAYELSQKDVVTYLNHRIIIRINSVVESQKSGAEKRFNGLPEEELKNLQSRLFPDGVEVFFQKIVDILMVGELNFKKIKNQFFMDNTIKLLQQTLLAELKKQLTESDDVISGFANYLLRQAFEDVYSQMAKKLLSLILLENKPAIKFLEFYNGSINIGSDGERYKAPILANEDGTRYNYVSILSIVKQHHNKDKLPEGFRAEINTYSVEVHKIKKMVLKLRKTQEELKEWIHKLELKVREQHSLAKRCKMEIEEIEGNRTEFIKTDKYEQTKQQYKEANKSEQLHIDQLQISKFDFGENSEKLSKLTSNYKRQASLLNKVQEQLESSQHRNKDVNKRYTEIVHTVAKVLMQKSKKVK